MITYCAHPACTVLIVVTEGAKLVRTCSSHQGQPYDVETDQQRLQRVCAAMGWRRVVAR